MGVRAVKALAAWLRKLADKIDPPKPTPDVGGGGGPPEPV